MNYSTICSGRCWPVAIRDPPPDSGRLIAILITSCLFRSGTPVYSQFNRHEWGMTKRWSDFLFAFSLRLLGGLVLGALAGLLFGFRMLLRWEARGNMGALGWWLAGWAVVGAGVAVGRNAGWHTPW